MTEATSAAATPSSFRALSLPEPLLQALTDVGYETPSPIQAATIPHLLAGRDVLGQAQTGTGKTAAFALPILARLDLGQSTPQALVLAPTRELAIQVAEAFRRYATHMPRFHVLPIYGGQSYGPQLSALSRGVHVVVGTPGRVIDHLERGSLDLSRLRYLVLDEADEMLRMGFIDDVEAILERTPDERQTALFSATMPPPIRRIAQTYLRDPTSVTIAARTRTAANIRQRYLLVSYPHKLDALTRILEGEGFEAMLVFTRTRQSTDELAERLQARGFAAAAINGDIAQAQRERTIAQLKDGTIDILVATDVAARGLDVDRVSHVLNFDVPHDTESYVHRIGRTGRAGRSGEAILFITPRERNLLRAIEHATRQPIERMDLPSVEAVNDARINKFKQQISEALAAGDFAPFQRVIEDYEREHDVPAVEIAAALAKLARGDAPLLLEPSPQERRQTERRPGDRDEPRRFDDRRDEPRRFDDRRDEPRFPPRRDRDERPFEGRRGDDRDEPRHADERPSGDRSDRRRFDDRNDDRDDRNDRRERRDHDAPDLDERRDEPAHERTEPRRERRPRGPGEGMETYRLEVGHVHGVRPGNIVGAIANEAGIDSQQIGRIEILDDHTRIDLPDDLPPPVIAHLKKVWVAGQQLRITRASEAPDPGPAPRRRPPLPGKRFGNRAFAAERIFRTRKHRDPRA